MFKLFRKKLNKKGFTMAELLIVVAIIAILVAIAIPIFTGLLDRAQVGVNTANARSLKGTAVAQILGDWDNLAGGAKGANTASPTAVDLPSSGWVASARFAENGDMQEVHVFMAQKEQGNLPNIADFKEGVVVKATGTAANPLKAGTNTNGKGPYVTSTSLSTIAINDSQQSVAKSGKIKPEYWIVVYIDDLEAIKTGA